MRQRRETALAVVVMALLAALLGVAPSGPAGAADDPEIIGSFGLPLTVNANAAPVHAVTVFDADVGSDGVRGSRRLTVASVAQSPTTSQSRL